MARKFFSCFILILLVFVFSGLFAGCDEGKSHGTGTVKDTGKPVFEKSKPVSELKNESKQTSGPETKSATEAESKNRQRLPRVSIVTNMGEMVIELNEKKAPITVKNFLRYVNEGFYDGLVFHRVIPRFMIQGGGFNSEMVEQKTHLPVRNESYNGLKNYRGTIAMARKDVPYDSTTSQFFINVNDNHQLNYTGAGKPGYAVFGKVIKGMDVADEIVKVPTTTKNASNGLPLANNPVRPVIIESVTVVPVLR